MSLFLQITGIMFWILVLYLLLLILWQEKLKIKWQRCWLGKFVCYRKYKLRIVLGKLTQEKLTETTWLYPTFINKRDAIKIWGAEYVEELYKKRIDNMELFTELKTKVKQ